MFSLQVMVDMGQPILTAADIPTKLPKREDGAVVKTELPVDGNTWIVTCVSMGNPHCVTFSHKDSEVCLNKYSGLTLFLFFYHGLILAITAND